MRKKSPQLASVMIAIDRPHHIPSPSDYKQRNTEHISPAFNFGELLRALNSTTDENTIIRARVHDIPAWASKIGTGRAQRAPPLTSRNAANQPSQTRKINSDDIYVSPAFPRILFETVCQQLELSVGCVPIPMILQDLPHPSKNPLVSLKPSLRNC
jgi:hypothetical protein